MGDEQASQSLGDWLVVPVADGDPKSPTGERDLEQAVPVRSTAGAAPPDHLDRPGPGPGQDPGGQELDSQNLHEQDPNRQDPNQQDPNRQDSNRQGPNRQDPVGREAGGRAVDSRPTDRRDLDRQTPVRPTPAHDIAESRRQRLGPTRSWAAVVTVLSIALLCAFGAIIWLLVGDDPSDTTSISATDPVAVSNSARTTAPTGTSTPDRIQPANPGPNRAGDPNPFPPPPPIDPADVDRLQRELDRALEDNPIVFGPGQTELNELQEAFVETTVSGLIDAFRGISVRIVGYDDPGAAPDPALAARRARTIERVILRTGVPPFVISTDGRTHDEAQGTDHGMGQVELEVHAP